MIMILGLELGIDHQLYIKDMIHNKIEINNIINSLIEQVNELITIKKLNQFVSKQKINQLI